MSSVAPAPPPATVGDLLAIPEGERFHEVIDGALVRKASPSGPHGRAQFRLATAIGGPYDRRLGGGGPGGWIFATEVEVRLEERQIYRPDVLGWKRERLAKLPQEAPVPVRPDWVCEILSPSNQENDLFKKMRVYARAQVPHYWIVDPMTVSLVVYRWTAEGYLVVVAAQGEERVKVEPFDAVEIAVRDLVEGE